MKKILAIIILSIFYISIWLMPLTTNPYQYSSLLGVLIIHGIIIGAVTLMFVLGWALYILIERK
jgi:polyferredoxin